MARALLYDTDAFGRLRDQHNRQGHKLVDIESYRVNGQLKWAGIWEHSAQAEKLNRNWEFCQLMNDRHVSYRSNGYELTDLERY